VKWRARALHPRVISAATGGVRQGTALNYDEIIDEELAHLHSIVGGGV
jgi:hypothetical protein